MKNSSIIALLVVCSGISGCSSEPEKMTEQAPPKEQKVVMVPAQGHGADTTAPPSNPTPTPSGGTPTDDTAKQPGDR